jgi:hypothetical protein
MTTRMKLGLFLLVSMLSLNTSQEERSHRGWVTIAHPHAFIAFGQFTLAR